VVRVLTVGGAGLKAGGWASRKKEGELGVRIACGGTDRTGDVVVETALTVVEVSASRAAARVNTCVGEGRYHFAIGNASAELVGLTNGTFSESVLGASYLDLIGGLDGPNTFGGVPGPAPTIVAGLAYST
jgi:hypothetical protein